VYGSSETGGVAWRQRARHGDTWQPLPGVHVRVDDGELSVQSPHLPDAQWWRSADRASLAADGMEGFELHGRADRIVKIEEKRISLTAMEQRLAASADVAEARVLMLPGAAPAAHDGIAVTHAVRPAVVAVLSAAGRARLAQQGKPALVADLRAQLFAAVDRIALPRRWRFVAALPVNAQGKTTEAQLVALFEPAPVRPLPDWLECDATQARLTLPLAPALRVFDGHFPGQPILPGVAQVDWAIAFARERFALPAAFLRLEQLKFSQPALPGMLLTLALSWNAAAATLQFEYSSDAGRHSGGRVVFAAESAS